MAFNPDQIIALLHREQQYLCADYTTSLPPTGAADQEGISDMRKIPSASSLRDVQSERGKVSLTDLTHHNITIWRQQMFDWACMVVDVIGANRESVAASFNLLDRFLVTELRHSRAPPITREDYQLFSMTCLYIATKVMDSCPNKLSVQTLVDMSKQFYTKQVIEQTEMDVLAALNWRIHAPTALCYAKLYSELFQSSSQGTIVPFANLTTITEIAVASGSFVACRPSIVGLAAVLIAVRGSTESLQDFLTNQAHLLPQDGDEFRQVYTHLEKLCS